MPRRLADLYVVGKELAVAGPDGNEEVTVWIQKLNPIQQEQAFGRAAAERAKVLTLKNVEPTHDDRVTFEAQADEIAQDRDTMIDMLSAKEIGEAEQACEAEVSEEDEWSKDGYLLGLQEAWDNGARVDYLDDSSPNYKEARRVFDELKRFAAQVEKAVEGHKKRIRKDFAGTSDEALRKRIVDQLIEAEADLRWLTEYRRSQVWLSVREPTDHRALYFPERKDVDDLSIEVLVQLIAAYQNLEVDPMTGKD
jgi:hypothetical protein